MSLGAILGLAAFGGFFVVMSLLDHKDLIPHGTDREGLFDNAYTFWPFGVGVLLLALASALRELEVSVLPSILIWPGLIAMLVGAVCLFVRPRWMWPQWRREMEARNTGQVTPAQPGEVRGPFHVDVLADGHPIAGIDQPFADLDAAVTAARGRLADLADDTRDVHAVVIQPRGDGRHADVVEVVER